MRCALIPCLRYADAPGAILFLCDAFGFVPQAVHTEEADQRIIVHAQLLLGDAMVMLASDRPDEVKDRYAWRTPAEAGGITMSVYAVVADPDAHHDRAVAAGARIVTAPHDNDGYPGREYVARDPEGHAWTFGSYDPVTSPA